MLRALNTAGYPRLVRVVDANDSAAGVDTLFYVMPRYAGPLRSENGFIEDFPCNINRVLEIVDQVLEAVEFMHDTYRPEDPVIHRDIHTGNVYLDESRDVYLGDFGLARGAREPTAEGHRTAAGEEFGPWQWRPPELTQGSTTHGDPKSDVYMVGGLLYELLTGGQYIDDPEPSPGVSALDSPAKDLRRICGTSDRRIEHVHVLLHSVLVRSTTRRMSAVAFRNAVAKIRAWSEGDEPPAMHESAFDALNAAAAVQRLPDGEEVIYRVFRKTGAGPWEWGAEILSRSFRDDPDHRTTLISAVRAEIQRLTIMYAELLKKDLRGERT